MKKKMITNQRDLRRGFWQEHPQLAHLHKRTVNYGNGKQYPTDVRVSFIDWLDALSKNSEVTQEFAFYATL